MLLSVNSTNETLLFDRFLIMYDLCVFTCIIFIFVFHCTHVRMSYVLNSYLLIVITVTVLVAAHKERQKCLPGGPNPERPV